MENLIGKTANVDFASFGGIAFKNKAGGTGLTNSDFNPKYLPESGVEPIEIVHCFYDYEVGYRFWGKPTTEKLKKYLAENAKEEIVYFSEHRIVF